MDISGTESENRAGFGKISIRIEVRISSRQPNNAPSPVTEHEDERDLAMRR